MFFFWKRYPVLILAWRPTDQAILGYLQAPLTLLPSCLVQYQIQPLLKKYRIYIYNLRIYHVEICLYIYIYICTHKHIITYNYRLCIYIYIQIHIYIYNYYIYTYISIYLYNYYIYIYSYYMLCSIWFNSIVVRAFLGSSKIQADVPCPRGWGTAAVPWARAWGRGGHG